MSEMKKTPNYQFNLPSLDDVADIEKLNENFTKIDTVLQENQSDNTVAEKIGQINTKIGEPTDDHTKQTVFGKIAGVLKRVVGIDDKVGTATDSATQQTLFGKIKGIASDVSNGLEPMDNKIGKPTDDHTKQTVFGKIADLKNMVSEKATQMINKITGVEGKVGTSADSSSTSTIFGRLKKVQETTENINTNMAGKSTVDTINNKIGTSADSSSSSTLFGKIAGVKSDTAKIGYSGQNAGTSSLFAWFQKIKEETADKTTVNNINNKIGTSGDSSGSTVFGKISQIDNKISQISVVRKITRGIGTGSVSSRGNIQDFIVNVSIVNPNKVVVLINNDLIGYGAYNESSGNRREEKSIYGAIVKEITTQSVTIIPAHHSSSSSNVRLSRETFEYCIIEFY